MYCIYYLFRKKSFNNSCYKLIYFRKPDKSDILAGFTVVMAGGALSFSWTAIVSLLQNHIPFFKAYLNAFFEKGNMFIDNNWYIFTLLSVAIIGPIVEELLIRGLIFGEMHRKMPVSLALILNGLIFEIFHGNFVQAVYSSIIGVAYAYVYYYTESFRLIYAMHIFNNFKETLPIPDNISTYITIGFLSLEYACVIPAVIAMKYLYKKAKSREKHCH